MRLRRPARHADGRPRAAGRPVARAKKRPSTDVLPSGTGPWKPPSPRGRRARATSARSPTRSVPRKSVTVKSRRALRRAQDVRRLLPAIAGVQRDQHRADGVDGEAGDDPRRAVGRPERHPVALLHAAGHEGPGDDGRPAEPSWRNVNRPVPSTNASSSPNRSTAKRQRFGDRPGRPSAGSSPAVSLLWHGCIHYENAAEPTAPGSHRTRTIFGSKSRGGRHRHARPPSDRNALSFV